MVRKPNTSCTAHSTTVQYICVVGTVRQRKVTKSYDFSRLSKNPSVPIYFERSSLTSSRGGQGQHRAAPSVFMFWASIYTIRTPIFMFWAPIYRFLVGMALHYVFITFIAPKTDKIVSPRLTFLIFFH